MKTYLLDTHAFLWFVADDPRLSTTAREVMENSESELLLSMASAWEIAIKLSLGRLELGAAFGAFMAEHLERNAIKVLPIRVDHVERVVNLPFHHRDPFDRLIVAQALVDGVSVIGTDRLFDAYGVGRVW